MKPTGLQQQKARYEKAAKRAGRTFAFVGGEGHTISVSGDTVTLRISGVLDPFWGTSAQEIIQDLDEHPDAKRIVLLVDSPGGLVDEGNSLYVDLRKRADDGVELAAEARGLVASAAMMPFLAADERKMYEGTMLMVHNPWALVFYVGDAAELEKAAEKTVRALKTYTENYARIVTDRSDLTRAAVDEAMDAETYYLPEEAAEAGFGEVVEGGYTDGDGDDEGKAQARAESLRILRGYTKRN